jgi:hypothetical protein
MKAPMKTTIERAGQRYVDDLVFVRPKPRAALDEAVSAALGDDDYPQLPIPVAYNRVPLRWIQPGRNRNKRSTA